MPLPRGAARCPSCGHEAGSAMTAGFATEGGSVGTPPRPRRQLLVIGGAVVVLVAMLVVLDGGGGEPAAHPAPASTTSQATTTAPSTSTVRVPTTARPTTTTAALPPMLLGEPSGVKLLLQTDQRAFLLDLDTGSIELAPSDLTGAVVPRRGGVVVSGQNGPGAAFLAAPYDGPPRAISPILAGQVLPSAEDDRIWMVTASGPPFRAIEVTVEGDVVTPTFDVPGTGYVTGAVDGGVVVASHGSIYVVRGPDDVTPVGSGDVLATSGHSIATLACDDRIECAVTIIDSDSGRRRATDATGAYGQAAFSPDGRTLVFYGGYESVRAILMLVDVATGTVNRLDDAEFTFNNSAPAFSLDGRWLFTVNNLDVHATRVEDGSVITIPLEGRIAGLNQVTVVPSS